VTVGRSNTARLLRRFQLGLLALTAVVLAGATTVFVLVHLTVDTASQQTMPAIMAASSAKYALGEADSDAMSAFGLGTVAVTGPGTGYQAQITLASQNLEQVAEFNQAGSTGSQQLLLIDSQLASYRQLIEQAHADYAAGSAELGVVEVVYASRLMHSQVLTELDNLSGLERAALTSQTSAFWLSGWAAPIWALPALVLLVGLVGAQRFLRIRFRRALNWALVAATVLLVALVAGCALTFLAASRLTEAQGQVSQLVAGRQASFAPLPAAAPANPVLTRLNQLCGTDTDHSGCGRTTPATPAQTQVATAAAANDRAAAADRSYGLEFGIPVLGLAIAALVLVGLQPRIDEYRRRQT
jgi:hypothetical protein